MALRLRPAGRTVTRHTPYPVSTGAHKNSSPAPLRHQKSPRPPALTQLSPPLSWELDTIFLGKRGWRSWPPRRPLPEAPALQPVSAHGTQHRGGRQRVQPARLFSLWPGQARGRRAAGPPSRGSKPRHPQAPHPEKGLSWAALILCCQGLGCRRCSPSEVESQIHFGHLRCVHPNEDPQRDADLHLTHHRL